MFNTTKICYVLNLPVFNLATQFYYYFLLISLILILVTLNGVPGENHRPVASHWQNVSLNVVSSTTRQINWPLGYNWNSVESGVKHHKIKQTLNDFVISSNFKSATSK